MSKQLTFERKTFSDVEWYEAPILDLPFFPNFELKFVLEQIPESDLWTSFVTTAHADENSDVLHVEEDLETLKQKVQETYEKYF